MARPPDPAENTSQQAVRATETSFLDQFSDQECHQSANQQNEQEQADKRQGCTGRRQLDMALQLHGQCAGVLESYQESCGPHSQ